MSVNVKTENVNDATVQVHIAFEKAQSRPKPGRKKQYYRNKARMRSYEPRTVRTGRNKATHRSTTKSRRARGLPPASRRQPLALPAPKPRSPA